MRARGIFDDTINSQHAEIRVGVKSQQYEDAKEYPEVIRCTIKKIHRNTNIGRATIQKLEEIGNCAAPADWMEKIAAASAEIIEKTQKNE